MAEEQYSINDFITEFKDIELTSKTLFKKDIIDDSENKLVTLSDELLDKYAEDIKSHLISIDLSKEEQRKYFYNPHAVSNDYYNTPHLWFLILRANQIYSKSQLNMNPMKIYDEGILDLIKTIINLEQEEIDRNNEEVNELTK